ncbi:MAG: DUF4954 family protein [Bacteroidales bacterium]
MHQNYYSYEWTWAYGIFREYTGKDLKDYSLDELVSVVEKWRSSVLEIDSYLYEDARKEFSLLKMTGFGIDGDESGEAS